MEDRMNPLNHGSLEACQRLQAAGIVLETDCKWSKTIYHDYELCNYDAHLHAIELHNFPAPSMAEVWRELPDNVDDKGGEYYPVMTKDEGITRIELRDSRWSLLRSGIENTNPTDALIDLLIWVRKV
jgi:hypothetical protein